MYSIDYSNQQIAVALIGNVELRKQGLNILSDQDSTQGLVKELGNWQERTYHKSKPREITEEEYLASPGLMQVVEVIMIPSWDHDTYQDIVCIAAKELEPGGIMRACIPGSFISCDSSMGFRTGFRDWFFDNVQKWMFVRATECGGEVLCIFSLTKPSDMI